MAVKRKRNPDKLNLTVLLDKEYYRYLQKLSFKLSDQEEERIGLSEVVRRALEAHWPMPKDQMEMF